MSATLAAQRVIQTAAIADYLRKQHQEQRGRSPAAKAKATAKAGAPAAAAVPKRQAVGRRASALGAPLSENRALTTGKWNSEDLYEWYRKCDANPPKMAEAVREHYRARNEDIPSIGVTADHPSIQAFDRWDWDEYTGRRYHETGARTNDEYEKKVIDAAKGMMGQGADTKYEFCPYWDMERRTGTGAAPVLQTPVEAEGVNPRFLFRDHPGLDILTAKPDGGGPNHLRIVKPRFVKSDPAMREALGVRDVKNPEPRFVPVLQVSHHEIAIRCVAANLGP